MTTTKRQGARKTKTKKIAADTITLDMIGIATAGWIYDEDSNDTTSKARVEDLINRAKEIVARNGLEVPVSIIAALDADENGGNAWTVFKGRDRVRAYPMIAGWIANPKSAPEGVKVPKVLPPFRYVIENRPSSEIDALSAIQVENHGRKSVTALARARAAARLVAAYQAARYPLTSAIDISATLVKLSTQSIKLYLRAAKIADMHFEAACCLHEGALSVRAVADFDKAGVTSDEIKRDSLAALDARSRGAKKPGSVATSAAITALSGVDTEFAAGARAVLLWLGQELTEHVPADLQQIPNWPTKAKKKDATKAKPVTVTPRGDAPSIPCPVAHCGSSGSVPCVKKDGTPAKRPHPKRTK